MDGSFTDVVDRSVDGKIAVLLLEEHGDVVGQRDLDIKALPEDGQHEETSPNEPLQNIIYDQPQKYREER